MVSESSLSNFSNSFTTRIFSDVAGDITIVVESESFLLHKFPLVARCGKFRKMVTPDTKNSNISTLELLKFPGGPQTFELVMKFCYGINFEITPSNVTHLHSAAEYLEMTEDYKEDNLIERTELYIDDVVVQNLEKSVQVLSNCEILSDFGIANKCIEGISIIVSNEESISGTLKWWVEDLSVLGIEFYRKIILAMQETGVSEESITMSLMHYAKIHLKEIGKDSGAVRNNQRVVLEIIERLIPTNYPAPLAFLFGMLRVASAMDASASIRTDLEKRIAKRMEMISLDDLLIPSSKGDSLFDVDTVQRMLINFLQYIEDEDNEEYGCEPGHTSLLKVGQLIDVYLAEIAADPYLSLSKFIGMIEILPDYARVIDDGLYTAIDIYLKAHPVLTEQECKKLCKLIDCEKLSQDACNHAAQNDRLPIQMTVKILYFEQIRLKSTVSRDSGDGFFSQKISSGVPSVAMSPRDNYASLRRENRELKLEISRMRVRVNELEIEQRFMKQEMADKSGSGNTFLTSISKGIARIGIFSGPAGGKRQQSSRK